MARPQIEFVQSQSLAWTPDPRFGLGDGVRMKVLSEDLETGAASLLVRYPAGYGVAAGVRGADEEFLVLDGELQVGDARYGRMAYAHWPSGYAAAARSSTDGATVLTFFSGDPRRPAASNFDPSRLVERLDTFAVQYTGNFHPEFPPGAGRKVLFADPGTGETSWLLGTLPMRWAERSEEHDHVEEMYLLAGESHGDRGVMRPGAYFWRPGLVPHGPYGTLPGHRYFFRTRGGPLVTRDVPPATPFHWWPAYRPAAPAELIGALHEAEPVADPW